MDLLLDTSSSIWALTEDERLGPAHAAIVEPRNRVYVSAVSAWEMAIKVAIGKLDVPPDLATWLPAELTAAGFTPLPVELRHALEVERLPRHHRDPFDRLLIAQAKLDGLTIVTADPRFDHYDVRVLRC